jgi:hypothetical protein
MAASWSAMAVSRSSSFPVLEESVRAPDVSYSNQSYILNTSSAVFRTMNERGSDYCYQLASATPCATSQRVLTVLYTLSTLDE